MIGCLHTVRRRLVREESGQALVLAIMIVVVGMLLALTAVAFALNGSQTANHDQHARSAQQAADAGSQATILAEAGSPAIGYDVSTGSLGNLLSCLVPEFNLTTGAEIGTTAIAASAGNGGCPSAVGTDRKPYANPWIPLSNGNYYETAFFPNTQTPTGSGGYVSGGLGIEFPEIVSIGCNTTASASAGAGDCTSNSSTSAKYARNLTILDPTGPLQAIEAGNNVYLQGGLSLVNSQTIVQNLLSSLGLSNLLSGLLCIASLGTAGCTTYPSMILDGNIAAGNDVQVPNILLGTNSDASIPSLLNGLASLNLGALGSLYGTLDYGNSQGTTVSTSGSSYSASGTPTLELANQVHATSGICTAASPSTTCTVARPTFTVGTSQALTTSTQLGVSATNLPSSGTSTGDLTLSSGRLTLGAGTYFFCNVNITGSAVVTGPSSGTAQIFVLQPGASQCTGDTGSQGNFTVAPGIGAPTGLSAILNGATSAINPSSVQIYVAGNPADKLAVNSTVAPSTTVSIGNSSAASQGMVVYAPRSNLTITTGAAFEGAAVGWNVTISALMVLQDLNLGNYPLASVVNGINVNQNVECSNAVTQLASPTITTAETTDTAGCT